MSSTQGHTNINTVHTTIDISVLLGEINRIADDSYLKGFESGYDVGVKKGKADGAKEFAEWLCKGVIPQDNPHVTYSVREMLNDGSSYEVEADVLITEWQKGAEGGRING